MFREKQGKVESGEERRKEERSLQLQYTKQLEEASRLALRQVRVFIQYFRETFNKIFFISEDFINEIFSYKHNLRVAEAKSCLVLAVKRKTLYSEYLESVVSTVKEEYKDVITLMERCQCLVLSRYLI